MDQLLFFVYFFYGLAFVGMGIAMLLESGRSPGLAEARLLRPLAAFGLIHGSHEWLESYLIQAEALGQPMPDFLPWLQIGIFTVSFIPLMIYAILTLLQVSPRLSRKHALWFCLFGIYAIGILASACVSYRDSPLPWHSLIDCMTRYLLAFPAALLSSLALRAQGRSASREGRHALANSLLLGAYSFAVYAIAQFIVPPLDMFPASVLNKDAFLAFAGFPIQAVRAVMAALITVGLVRGTQVVEQERRTQFLAMQQARLEAVEQQDALRRDLLRHTVQAQEDERARVARELHDETAQMLTAISLDLATLKTVVPRNKDVNTLIDRLQKTGKEMSKGLYRLVHELRPAQLDVLGLSYALRTWTERDCCSSGLQVNLRVEGQERRLDPVIETVFFRVMQEALANVTRHAGVQEAELRLQYLPERVSMRISDHGCGFDPAMNFSPPRGWGLAGMRERVDSIGGEMNITSELGKGTTIEISVPLNGITVLKGKEVTSQ